MPRTKLRRPWLLVLGATAVALVLGTAYADSVKKTDAKAKIIDKRAVSKAVELENAFASVAESVSPSVVSIQVEVNRPQMGGAFPFFSMPDRGGIVKGGGSGIIIRSDGFVLTNNHVVSEASRIDVELQDGRSFEAEVVGTDPATDLALLRIDTKGLTPVTFAASDASRVGQWVIAIGSPFGLDYTVTTGVLSAKGRGGIGANEIEDYLQTDASINPGNSGGPLVDLDGNVLGVNTMIIGRNSGIGFAIPSEIAQRVAGQLIEHGEVKRAWLGVSFQEMTPELATHFGGDFQGGALISAVVPGGPADEAGLKAGDVIVAVGETEIRQGHDLLRTVLRHSVGERLTVKVVRDGSTQTKAVVTGERPSDGATGGSKTGPRSDEFLGLGLEELTPGLRARLGYEGAGEVVVRNVVPGSDADRSGFRPGDIILKADNKAVSKPQDVRNALKDGKALLYVERDQRQFFQLLTKSD